MGKKEKNSMEIGSIVDLTEENIVDYGRLLDGIKRVCYRENGIWLYVIVDRDNRVINGPFFGCVEIIYCDNYDWRLGFWTWGEKKGTSKFYDYKMRLITDKVPEDKLKGEFMQSVKEIMRGIYVNDKKEEIIKEALNYAVNESLYAFWDKITFPYGINLNKKESAKLIIEALEEYIEQ